MDIPHPMRYQFTLIDVATVFDEVLNLSFTEPLFFKPGNAIVFGTQTAIVASATYTDTMPFKLPVAPLTFGAAIGAVGIREVDDVARICRHLSIAPSYRGQLTSHLQTYETQYPGTLAEISRLLAELDSIEAFTASQGLDENLYLIKAGSLEWAPGGKAQASEGRRLELKTMLSTLISADCFRSTRMNGSTRVIKGFA
jgi:hypothetical protein